MITTSYFASPEKPSGVKVAITRYFPRYTKSGEYEWLKTFGPSLGLLTAYHEGELSWQEYSRRYLAEQRKHLREHPEDFKMLLRLSREKDVTLYCYERYEGEETHCHRFLLFELLKKAATKFKIKADFVPESRATLKL